MTYFNSVSDADLEKLKELRRLQLKFKVSDEVNLGCLFHRHYSRIYT